MKKRTFRLMAASTLVIAMGIISCSKGSAEDNGDPNDPPVGTTILLASPTTVNFSWSNPAAQTVKVTTDAVNGWTVGASDTWYTATKDGNNLILNAQTNSTGVKRSHSLKISATGAADVTISVNQSAEGTVDPSLQGSAYFVWALDPISYETVKSNVGDKLVDLGPDGVNRVIDIWPMGESMEGYQATGPNFYGTTTGGWMAFKIGSIGWSGGGYAWNYEDRPIDWSDILADDGKGWYLHAAIRATRNAGMAFRFVSKNGPDDPTSYWLYFDNYSTLSESDWTEVEVSMEDIMGQGWEPPTNGYTMTFHGSGKAGQDMQWDAVFIYKK